MLNLERIKKAIASNELSTLDLSYGTVRDSNAHSLHEPTAESWIADDYYAIKGLKVLAEGRVLSWSDHNIKLWDMKEKKCLESFSSLEPIDEIIFLTTGGFVAKLKYKLDLQYFDNNLKPTYSASAVIKNNRRLLFSNGNLASLTPPPGNTQILEITSPEGRIITSFRPCPSVYHESYEVEISTYEMDKIMIHITSRTKSGTVTYNEDKFIDQNGTFIPPPPAPYGYKLEVSRFIPVMNGTAAIRIQNYISALRDSKIESHLLDHSGKVIKEFDTKGFMKHFDCGDRVALVIRNCISNVQEHEVRLINAKGEECAPAVELPVFKHQSFMVFVSGDDHIWSVYISIRNIVITNLNTSKTHILKGHLGNVVTIKPLPNDLLGSLDDTGTLIIWDVHTQKRLATLTGAGTPQSPWEILEDSIVFASEGILSFLSLQDLAPSRTRRPEDVLDVLKALETNTSVTRIHLHDLAIGDEVAKALASLLKTNNKIQFIDLHNTRVSDVGAECLLMAIQAHPNAPMIDLSGTLVTTDMQNRFDEERAKQARLNTSFDNSVPSLPLAPIPSEFLCPLTKKIMKEPVIISDGISYEKEAILSWLETHDTAPSGVVLDNKSHLPNRLLQNRISSFLKTHPEAVEPHLSFGYLHGLISEQAEEIARLKMALQRHTDAKSSLNTAETASVFHPLDALPTAAPRKAHAGAGLELNYPEHSD